MPISAVIGFVSGFLASGGVIAAALAYAAVSGGLALLSRALIPSFDGPTRADTRITVRSSVAPVQYILGRVRTGGSLVWYGESDEGKRVHYVFALSRDPIDAIEKMWIDGDEFRLSRRSGNTYRVDGRTAATELSEKVSAGFISAGLDPDSIAEYTGGESRIDDAVEKAGHITIHGFLKADGTEGTPLRDYSMDSDFTDWTSAHKMNGISWAHVSLYQPDYGNDIDNRVWTNPVPRIEFQLRGIKPTWPGQSTPRWTQNAAALRYWYMRNIQGIPAEAFNEASVRAAHAVCGEEITIALPDGYEDFSPTSERYTINGAIQSGEDITSRLEEMDWAWAGDSIEWDGQIYFVPGAERTATMHLMPDAMLLPASVQTQPDLQDRVNSVSMTLDQSIYHAHTTFRVGDITDPAAEVRDMEFRHRDLGTRSMVNDPIIAARLLTMFLRRIRATTVYNYRIRAQDGMEWMGAIPGDRILVSDPERFLRAAPMRIVSMRINPDWTIDLQLNNWPDGLYSDSTTLPPLPTPVLIPRARAPAAATGVAVSSTVEISEDGTVITQVRVSWNPVSHPQTTARVRSGAGASATLIWGTDDNLTWGTDDDLTWGGGSTADWIYQITDGTSAVFSSLVPGQPYDIQVRHTSRTGTSGPWTDAFAYSLVGDLDPPETPATADIIGIPGGYRLEWEAPTELDFKAMEVWDRTLQGEDNLEGATLRGEVSDVSFTRVGIGSELDLDILLRAKDRTGNLGPIRRVGRVRTQVLTLGETGNPTVRARGDFYAEAILALWDNSLANETTPGANVLGDRITQSLPDGSYAETRSWNGITWEPIGRWINGNLVATGSITSLLDLVSGGTVRSGNYVAGSRGWAIDNDGNAEFDAASIRGTIRADNVDAATVQNVLRSRIIYLRSRDGGGIITSSEPTTQSISIPNADNWKNVNILWTSGPHESGIHYAQNVSLDLGFLPTSSMHTTTGTRPYRRSGLTTSGGDVYLNISKETSGTTLILHFSVANTIRPIYINEIIGHD